MRHARRQAKKAKLEWTILNKSDEFLLKPYQNKEKHFPRVLYFFRRIKARCLLTRAWRQDDDDKKIHLIWYLRQPKGEVKCCKKSNYDEEFTWNDERKAGLSPSPILNIRLVPDSSRRFLNDGKFAVLPIFVPFSLCLLITSIDVQIERKQLPRSTGERESARRKLPKHLR